MKTNPYFNSWPQSSLVFLYDQDLGTSSSWSFLLSSVPFGLRVSFMWSIRYGESAPCAPSAKRLHVRLSLLKSVAEEEEGGKK